MKKGRRSALNISFEFDLFVLPYQYILISGSLAKSSEASMAKNTSVSLGHHFEQFVDELIASGRYASASEVVRAGLRKLEEERDRKVIGDSIASGTATYSYHSLLRKLENEREQWLKDNAKAIEAYNEKVASKGAFSDGVRKF